MSSAIRVLSLRLWCSVCLCIVLSVHSAYGALCMFFMCLWTQLFVILVSTVFSVSFRVACVFVEFVCSVCCLCLWASDSVFSVFDKFSVAVNWCVYGW